MNPRYVEADAADHYPEINACSVNIFGHTAEAADATPRPAGWDKIEKKPVKEQVDVFEAEGWDVTDNRRRPLRMLEHWNVQLWLALRGVSGKLPAPVMQDDDEDAVGKAWGSALQAEATRFRKNRR